MAQIHYNWQLREAYKILNRWNQIFSEMGENPNDLDFVQETKKEIRRYNKWLDERHKEIVYRHYDEDGTSYRELVKMPEWVKTKDEAEAWFHENVYHETYYEPWDCTGQWFTFLNHIFKRNGNYMVYHTVIQDV